LTVPHLGQRIAASYPRCGPGALHYIDSIVGSDQSLRRWLAGVAVVVLLLVGVLLSGCGSSGDKMAGSEQTTAGGATTAAGDVATAPTSGHGTSASAPEKKGRSEGVSRAPRDGGSPGQKAGHHSDAPPGSKHAAPTTPTDGQGPRGTGHPTRQSQQDAASTAIEGASPVVVKKLRKRCPKGMEATACDELIKSYLAAQNPAPPPPQPGPGQCPESLSRAECEAAVAAVKASEMESSVSLQECLADMTPRCEETLRPAFEAQKQAQEQTGE
jgi:hypothetical protein